MPDYQYPRRQAERKLLLPYLEAAVVQPCGDSSAEIFRHMVLFQGVIAYQEMEG